jgi:hypothetical protein
MKKTINITTTRRSNIGVEIEQLKVGEDMTVFKHDYDNKSPISVYLANSFKGRKFQTRRLASGAGWVVKRIK